MPDCAFTQMRIFTNFPEKMKGLFLSVLLAFGFLSSFGQAQKITIFCDMDNRGNIYYNSLDKILPDSIRASLLITGKGLKIRHVEDGLMWMALHGWTVVGLQDHSTERYLLRRELVLDEAGSLLFTRNLENLIRATGK